MDNLLIFVAQILFDNGVIPIKFGGSVSLAILGFIAYSNGKDDKFWRELGIVVMVMAGIGGFLVGLNLL